MAVWLRDELVSAGRDRSDQDDIFSDNEMDTNFQLRIRDDFSNDVRELKSTMLSTKKHCKVDARLGRRNKVSSIVGTEFEKIAHLNVIE